jgi:hypothetical protein
MFTYERRCERMLGYARLNFFFSPLRGRIGRYGIGIFGLKFPR